jgi:GxGYxYP putative glycoside hydrolase C-terminal domain
MKKRCRPLLLLVAFMLGLAATSASAAPPSKPVYVFDLWGFFSEAEINDSLDRANFVYFITALQGIVNRDEPRLYLLASLSLFDLESRLSTRRKSEIEVTELDQYWLDHLIASGALAQEKLVRTSSLASLLKQFHGQIKGLARWEMRVPATVNAVLAAAGTRDLLPVGLGLGNGQLDRWLATNAPDLLTQLDLTGQFHSGQAGRKMTVAGVSFSSSGSAKTDVYHYIRQAFLVSEAASPFHIYFNSDAIMWGERRKMYAEGIYGHLGDRNEFQQNGMFNNDYWIARRGLFVDLYVWDDHAPNDDPGQPLGADLEAWNDLLELGYKQRGGEFGVVGGFVPWWIKYADDKHDAVSTEWRFIDLMTSYNMANDADAAFGLSNASFFMHLPPVERSKIPPPPAQFPPLEPKTVYVSFFMLDYDGSAWLNQGAEAIYEAGGRGKLPLNWAVNPILNERVPHAYRAMVENRTPLDFFGIEDDGAGYISPVRLVPGKRLGRVTESGIPYYEKFARRYHERFGIQLTPFYITPTYHPDWGEMAARLTPNGFGMNIPSPALQVNGTPMMTLESFHVNEVRDLGQFIERLHRESAEGQLEQTTFYPIRCILLPPYALVDIVAAARAKYPKAKVEIVDGFTLFHLRRIWLQQTLVSDYRDRATISSTPQSNAGLRPIVSNVANDGYGRFETNRDGEAHWILRRGAERSRIFFQTDPAFAQHNDGKDLRVKVQYLDNAIGSMELEFAKITRDGIPTSYIKAHPKVLLLNSGQRKTAEFTLSRALLVQGMHHRSDFCLAAPEGVQIYSVTLSRGK